MIQANRTATRTTEPGKSSAGRAQTSLRQVLWVLVLALALPAILVAGGGLYSVYRAEQRATDLRLQEITRAMSLSLDREIEKAEAALRVLASSPSIRTGDFAAFHRQAMEAGLAEPAWIALFEPDGKVLLNTRVPYGTPLPDSIRPETIRRVQETRRAELSDLAVRPATGQALVTLDVPVVIDGRVAYILSSAIGPEVFQKLIQDQRIAAGWNAAVLDRSGKIVARSRSPEQFIGQSARPRLLEAITASSEGQIDNVTLDGIPARTYFSRSQPFGWSFIISLPASELRAALQRPLIWLLVLAGVIVAGIVLAAHLSRQIAKPVDQLVASAKALGRGEPVTDASTHVLEFDAIRKALAEAATAIRMQKQSREEVIAHVAESEARLRLALNAGDLGSWEFTPSTGEFVTSATCRANFGRAADESFTYTDLVASIHPEDRAKQAEAVAEAMTNRTDLHVEYRVIWPDGSEHWIRVSGRTRIGTDGSLSMVGVSQNITERREADERQALLLHELNHRVKNTLATVQSIASMTRRSAEAGDPNAWDAFMGRLQGLAKTHDLLTSTNWNGALLENVLRNELDPYQDPMQQRIRLRGPRVNLQPSAVLAMGLAVHELATNAVKYGSLSMMEGRVSVMWAVTTGPGPASLLVEWTESGGPRVKPPERQGFGTKLIQRGLAQQLGGDIKLDFAPAGIRCVITFPLKSVVVALDATEENEERYAS
ncbi:sensor histidine kinase [Microvirga lenta]|uniref:sensor histidine kinase n=1 Tax=Microvirga lenta TaxID=2881337 RepID=UPI001CFEBE4C|nr:HWE histidine kinase domain-containing protein [Microvirga lenta]MCB5174528.1 PAS domain-containing protein [Microvirga lenta]